MPRATVMAMLVLVLVLPLLAACGGGDEPVADEVDTAIAEAEQGAGVGLEVLSDASLDELRTQAGRAADAIREQADALEGIDVPAPLEAVGEQLADTLRTLADRLEQQVENVDPADVQRLLEALDGLNFTDAGDLLEQLRAAGLDLSASEAP